MRAEQIIPLLFSFSLHLSQPEADKAFRLFVSWSVKFLIAGGTRAGRLEKPYSDLCMSISNGIIKKARELRDEMKNAVPNDKDFEEAFSSARVSRTYLARYYLRAIDNTLNVESIPEYVPNEDEKEINLEHIMPLSADTHWNLDEEDAEGSQKLIGNMILLSTKKNTLLGNLPFLKKKEVFANWLTRL